MYKPFGFDAVVFVILAINPADEPFMVSNSSEVAAPILITPPTIALPAKYKVRGRVAPDAPMS
jgi:hypothetical protein